MTMLAITIALAVAAGAFSWTFLEYVMHRFLGHDRRFRGNPFGVEHVRHHIEGDYFAPAWKKSIAATVAAGLLGVPCVHFAGAPGLAYVLGLVGFYGVYEILHRGQHVRPGLGAYGRWARRHHFTHHFVDARINHGVTTSLWDHVFGTYRRVDKVTVPAKLCMAWLEDPETGGVRADWADTFVLVTPPRPSREPS